MDFQASLSPLAAATYRLAPGRPVEPPSLPVRITDDGSALEMGNGRLAVRINRWVACLLESIKLDGRSVLAAGQPLQMEMMTGDGTRYAASKPNKVTIESQGPMRATVLVSGEFVASDGTRLFDGKVGYDLRATAYAGKPMLKLDFTLKNDGFYAYRNERKPRQWLYFQYLRLDLPLNDVPEECAWTVGGVPVQLGVRPTKVVQWIKQPGWDACGLPVSVFKDETERARLAGAGGMANGFYYELDTGYMRTGAPGKLPGWAELSAGTRPVIGAAMSKFWQNSPRGFEIEPASLSLLPWPRRGFWPRTQTAHDEETYQFEGGRHKTVEMLLWFGPQERPAGELYGALEVPLFARASSSWYRDTNAIWPLASAGLDAKDAELKEALQRYDRLQVAKVDVREGDPAGPEWDGSGGGWGRVSIPEMWERSPEMLCGWMNYGDLIWGHGYCSLHYDWPLAMLMQYLRLGNREFLDVGLDMGRHRYDIDQYHVMNTATWLGGFQRYEKGQHGFLQRQRLNPQWEINPAPSHTWNRGLLLQWAMTGDPRAREAAEENGRAYHNFFYGQHKLGAKDKIPWNEFRSPGWAIENWLALYEYTGEKKYLDWANEIFTKTLLAMEAENGSRGHIVKDGRQSAQFTCYMVEPVARLHRLTGRSDAAGFLRRVLDWQRAEGTMHGVEKDGKYLPILWIEDWGNRPSEEDTDICLGAGNAYGIPMLDGYAYLYQIYGRKQDLEYARRLFEETMFYYGLGNGALRSDRTPLGYHYLGSPFGSTPKIHAWTGRYCQLYLSTEEHCGAARASGRAKVDE